MPIPRTFDVQLVSADVYHSPWSWYPLIEIDPEKMPVQPYRQAEHKNCGWNRRKQQQYSPCRMKEKNQIRSAMLSHCRIPACANILAVLAQEIMPTIAGICLAGLVCSPDQDSS